jgi:hypothetical protein
MATDLQSAPFGHLGTCPKFPAHDTIIYTLNYHLLLSSFIRMMKKEEQAGPHTAPPSLSIKDESGDLWAQPCL